MNCAKESNKKETGVLKGKKIVKCDEKIYLFSFKEIPA